MKCNENPDFSLPGKPLFYMVIRTEPDLRFFRLDRNDIKINIIAKRFKSPVLLEFLFEPKPKLHIHILEG